MFFPVLKTRRLLIPFVPPEALPVTRSQISLVTIGPGYFRALRVDRIVLLFGMSMSPDIENNGERVEKSCGTIRALRCRSFVATKLGVR